VAVAVDQLETALGLMVWLGGLAAGAQEMSALQLEEQETKVVILHQREIPAAQIAETQTTLVRAAARVR
jgi:hypothetical protein